MSPAPTRVTGGAEAGVAAQPVPGMARTRAPTIMRSRKVRGRPCMGQVCLRPARTRRGAPRVHDIEAGYYEMARYALLRETVMDLHDARSGIEGPAHAAPAQASPQMMHEVAAGGTETVRAAPDYIFWWMPLHPIAA